VNVQTEQTAFRPEGLLRADAYPHPVGALELVETHISWVVLTGQLAYKIKKPVRFDFIDASSLDRRRRLCEEELRLNGRLAPDLYLAVLPIGGTPDAPRIGTDEHVLEYAVQMRQFDRSGELPTLLAAGEVRREEISRLAVRLAGFHARAPAAGPETDYGTCEQLRATMLANLAALAAQCVEPRLAHALNRLSDWTRDALSGNRIAIELRRATGAVRECHGDLHARNIVRWKGELVPFDCLEFDPALRWIDVASEMAFLHMDLLAHARTDLASILLSDYLEAAGDYESLRLMRFYEVYRALVRAKVDGLDAARAASSQAAERAVTRRASRIDLAQRLAAPPDPPLILMHGVSGSGKSWLSGELVPALGVLRVRSDLERKRIVGLAAGARADAAPGEGLYAARNTDRTYARLLECAEHALIGGHGIVIDAAFLEAEKRELFRGLARRLGRRFLLVSCHARPDVLRTRVQARRGAARDPSDATLAVLEHQLASRRPLEDCESSCAVAIDTTAGDSAAAAIELIRTQLPTGCAV